MIRKLLFFALFFPSFAFAAYDYDGSNDHHSVDNINVGSTAQSVCGWINITSAVADGNALFSYGNGADSSAGRGFVVAITGARTLRAYGLSGGDAISCYKDPSPTILATSTDYHICVVYSNSDGVTATLYINGNVEATCSVDMTAASSTDDFLIAEPVPAMDYGFSYFDGTMTQVALWNYALSEAQVDSMADKSTCPTSVQSANLQVFLEMDASPAVDGSSNGFTVSTGDAPSLVSDLSGLPCGVAAYVPRKRFNVGFNQCFNEGMN